MSPKKPDRLAQKLLDALDDLGLPIMREALQQQLAKPDDDISRLEWLWRIVDPQLGIRIERRIERRLRAARLPARKTFDSFDFAFQPSLDKDLVMELATLRFIDGGINVLLAGMSGTGKTHIALALAMAACVDNRSVLYTTSAAMLAKLNASLADNTLNKAIRPFVRSQLLVIDEVGLEQVERMSASRSGLLQKVLFARHQNRTSTVITSNIPWEAWGDYLDDHLGAAAILDRLIQRSRVIIVNGPSYREHAHKQDIKTAYGNTAVEDKTAISKPTKA